MDWANDDQRQVCHEYQQLLPAQPGLSGILRFEVIVNISYSGDTLAGEKLYNKPSF